MDISSLFSPPIVDYMELELADRNSYTTCILFLVGSPSFLAMFGFGKLSMYDFTVRDGIFLSFLCLDLELL